MTKHARCVTFYAMLLALVLVANPAATQEKKSKFSKAGFGRWTNSGIGMLGAVVGGCLFWLLGIDFGLADLKVTFEDLLSAFVSSLLCIVAWRLIRKRAGQKN